MPCRSEGYSDPITGQTDEKRAERKKELDLVTKLLCGLMGRLQTSFLTQEEAEWYIRHKKWDKQDGR